MPTRLFIRDDDASTRTFMPCCGDCATEAAALLRAQQNSSRTVAGQPPSITSPPDTVSRRFWSAPQTKRSTTTMTTPQRTAIPSNSAITGAASMSAIVHDEYGSAPGSVLRLAKVSKPAPGAEDVLVRVHAASVDRGTWHIMAGLPYPIRLAGFGMRVPKHLNPGRALAGTVEEVGADVDGFQPGDEVFGTCDGSFAEYVLCHTGKLARKPSTLSFDEAAAIPVSGVTALQAVRDHARVKPGEQVLIVGASGGVGSFAVQIAKVFGGEVTGVCSGRNVALVEALGADHVIDYSRTDFSGGDRRYDVILDIGGNSSLTKLRRALTTDGRLVIVGGETDGRWLGGSDRSLRAIALSPFVKQQLGTFVAKENAADLTVLCELVDSGQISPFIDRVFPLSDVADAIRHLVEGRSRGKTAVAI